MHYILANLVSKIHVARGRNSVLTMHGHNVQALLILIGHRAEVTGHFFPCNSFDIITIYAYFNSQFFIFNKGV